MEITETSTAFSDEKEIPHFDSSCNQKLKPKNTPQFRTCSFFYKNGYCKFGNNCKYKHLRRNSENKKHFFKGQKLHVSQNSHKFKQPEENILQNSNKPTSSQQVCEYFDEMFSNSKKDDNCEYLHSVDSINNKMISFTLSPTLQNIPKKIPSANNKSKKKTVCYYFKKGFCYKGDSCKYYHPQKNHCNSSDNLNKFYTENDSNSLSDKNIKPMNEKSIANKHSSNFRRTLNFYDVSSMTEDAISELRSIEINQLKKRFPSFEIITENQTYSILFQPSDPDWAFDVKKLKLEVEFPEKYPSEKCKISVIHSAENIPLLLIKHLNSAISHWINKKFVENSSTDKVELMFRPFLRWFDKNLEDLFIAGLRKVKQDIEAKEAGIEFVPVETLFSSSGKTDAESSSGKTDAVKHYEEDSSLNNTLQPENHIPITEKENLSSELQNNKSWHFSGNDGMKIVLTNLELIEGAATFICTKISVTLQCCRCKTSFNMKSVPKKNNSYVCTKCSKNVGFTFEPSIVHQFSSVLGNLHLLDCVAVDVNLIECHFLIDCLNCTKRISCEGIHYGQKHKMWCTFCNEKILMSIGAVKFQTLKLTSAPVAKYPVAKKVEKVKDPVIKEGEPLPNFGACKHYKKSFRWLRFPCCGRLYACDECHNEKETDHEMKYASRMLCGFCSKEQPYSREKPCLLCSQSLTKKSGSHWEGGKGCRNKILMSREDKQKYSGVSKTVSKKAQSNKTKKKQ